MFDQSEIENLLILVVLVVLLIINVYSVTNPSTDLVTLVKPQHYVISEDTAVKYKAFMEEFTGSQSSYWGSSGSGSGSFYSNYNDSAANWSDWEKKNARDDFLAYGSNQQGGSNEPIVPSEKFICDKGWVAVRSEMNYKYLWMHTGDSKWMGATATIDTPLHRKAFEIVPLTANCSESGGWVRLREGDSNGFLLMVKPTGTFAVDEWVVKIGTDSLVESANDTQYHFLLENDGYILNRAAVAFVNVITEAEYAVRGHSSSWDRTKPAGREYGAMMHYQLVEEKFVLEAIAKEEKEQKEAADMDKTYIEQIKGMAVATNRLKEKRIISFGLYGAREKYTQGAIRNAEISQTYFPGWVCRFYVTNDVPTTVVDKLKDLGAEIEQIPPSMGYSSGMFWRFMVAQDSTVDRYIVRDVDSRLNARDAFAVNEWIESKYAVHIIRDHINHCLAINGGMWGGVKGAIPDMKELIMQWTSRDEYSADLHFLEQKIWPDIKGRQLSHDSYCCDRYPNTKPFPTRRAMTYQHVGQVFDAEDNPRLMDIDGFMRGVPTPGSCRKKADWIYG